MFEIIEFNPVSEESRYNLILPEIFYKFSMGLASRSQQSSNISGDKGLIQSFDEGAKSNFLFENSPSKSLLGGINTSSKILSKSSGPSVNTSEEGTYSMGESLLNGPGEYSSFLDSQIGFSTNNSTFSRSKSETASSSSMMNIGFNAGLNANKQGKSYFPGFNVEEPTEIANAIYSDNISDLNLGSFVNDKSSINNDNSSNNSGTSLLANRLMMSHSGSYTIDDIIDKPSIESNIH